jgi:SAM-dependent methyltransferase
MEQEFRDALSVYMLPSQSMWRAGEIHELRKLEVHAPILEIGSSDGKFSSLIFDHIDDAIDINARAVQRYKDKYPNGGGLYGRVQTMDARAMTFAAESFATVFASSTLEHIPGVEGVLSDIARVLRPGGRLIATTPVAAMNDNLMLRSAGYVRSRHRRLSHANVWTPAQWKEKLLAAGFTSVEFHPCLAPETCRTWDVLDAPLGIGAGRYRVGPIAEQILRRMPHRVVQSLHNGFAKALAGRIKRGTPENACNFLWIATK